MATRGTTLNFRHVEALNLIDVDFSEPSEQSIPDAWKDYLDHLNIKIPDEKEEADSKKRDELNRLHQQKSRDLLAELLQRMGAALGYKFNFIYLKDRAYYPQGHFDLEEEQGSVRRGLIELLWKGTPLIVRGLVPPIEIPPKDQQPSESTKSP